MLANLLAMAFLVALAVVVLSSSRSEFQRRALDASENLASGLQQSLFGSIGRIDLALQTIVQAHRREASQGATEPIDLTQLLEEQQRLVADADSLRITDSAGIVRYGRGVSPDVRVDLSDRDFFVRARDNGDQALIFSEPTLARISKKWVIVLARRLSRSDGSFAGVVYANLASDHFEKLFATVNVGSRGAISLRTATLQLVARRVGQANVDVAIGSTNVSPELRDMILRSPDSGRYIAQVALDQIERANSYRRIVPYPLIVLAGLSVSDYLDPWRAEVAIVSTLATLIALLLAGSSWFFYGAWCRKLAARQALIREGERYRAVVLTASDGFHMLDRDGNLTEVSESFATMLGYPREQMIGMNISQWDAGTASTQVNHAVRHFHVGDRFEFETRLRRKDGNLIDVEVVGVAVQVAGADVLYWSGRDVTSRKLADAALRASEAFLDRTGRVARVGGWELDLMTGVITWSDQTCTIHDVEAGYRPTLEQALQFYPAEARAAVEQQLREGASSGKPWDFELPMTTATGRPIWVRAFGETEFSGDRPVRLVGALQDITEDRARRSELEREQALRLQIEHQFEELQQLLIERSEMLNVLAHEVRQPLNNASAALQSATHVLAGTGQEAAAARLQIAQDLIGRITAGIDNTLASALLLVCSGPVEHQDTDIDTLIGVVIADMALADRQRIVIDRRTTTRTARMDMGLMRLALRNLLANALKYSPADSIVTVGVADCDDPLALIIEVSDAGPGIPSDLLPKLFQRGARGALTRGGHGLGLYIVRRVMELHGGVVTLIRDTEAGSTFRVVIVQAATSGALNT